MKVFGQVLEKIYPLICSKGGMAELQERNVNPTYVCHMKYSQIEVIISPGGGRIFVL